MNQSADSSGIAPLQQNGITYSDAKAKANRLNEQFVSVFFKDSKSADTDSFIIKKPLPEMDIVNITTSTVAKLLQNLQTHKATGLECIPAHLLKVTADKAAKGLWLIF